MEPEEEDPDDRVRTIGGGDPSVTTEDDRSSATISKSRSAKCHKKTIRTASTADYKINKHPPNNSCGNHTTIGHCTTLKIHNLKHGML